MPGVVGGDGDVDSSVFWVFYYSLGSRDGAPNRSPTPSSPSPKESPSGGANNFASSSPTLEVCRQKTSNAGNARGENDS